ncbi:Spectrin beta chain non-erythrocytic 5 [Dissostichus eleginoides]|uniref:Spectrin beta chain non-erythrocytic 5 n=1 Tax=Dissostichus eleginoides TaxID=100907 RepID=A0AAD9FA96_DISEL|nr:Spectrin beta chain non-erythrocytic 5 [Dissostichus eleginoides]
MLLLQGQDCGFDVDSVENLIRRHEETEREVGVIQERSKALEMEVSDHLKARSVMSDKLKSKQKEVQKALKTLDQEVKLRKEKLQEAHQLQLFKANQRLLLEWSVKQSGEMAEKGLPKTRAEAERLIVEHQDWKTEIDARAERIDSVRDFGLGLIRSGHGLKAEIQKALNQLEEAKSGLDRAWLNRNTTLEQARTLQVFLSSVDQCESWLSNKEAFLSNQDLGSMVMEVETLQRKHAQFEEALEAQVEQLDEVETLGQKMIQQKHYDSDNIRGKTKALAARRSQLQQQSRSRHKALDRSLKLQQFLSSSYQAKLLKHQSFEAEILANRYRVDTLTKESEKLLSDSRSAEGKVRPRLRELTDSWDALIHNCKEKKTRLQEAYQALQFQRSLDDMEQSVGSVESELNNEDCGSDLPSVTRLLQALQGLEEEVDGLRDRIQGLVDTAKSFHSQGNFLAEEIQTRVAHTINRYNSLSEPLLSRRETLEAWQVLFQFYRDLEEEAVTQEISSRAPLVQAVQEAGHSLVRGRHFASHDIRERLKELKHLHEDLLTEAERKGKLLQEALSIHTFLTEWEEERRGDGDSAEEAGLCGRRAGNQRRTVEKLQESGASLQHLGHPNSPLVSEALPGVAERFETLLRLSTSRRSALEDQLRLYVFEREAKELQTWLTSKKTVVESKDCGQDLEDVEVLQKKLEVLVSETSGLGRTRLTSVQQLSRGLQTDSSARRRDDALSYLWEELNSSIRAREQSLQAAREVHQFNHDVDELKGWMGEKEAVLEAEDQEHDLHSIQTLLRQHEALERDLALISEEVRKSKDEGRALSRRQPPVRSAVTQRLEELEVFWRNVQEKASQRRARLGQAEDVQKYLSLCSELMAWLREMLSLVRSEALSVEGDDLEHLIKKHEEYRVQIDRQLSKSQAVKEEGRRLIEGRNFMSPEVEERVCELEELEEKVVKVWEETRILYEEELEICLLQRELEQAERWLSSYENTLMAEDYGDSVSDVMELLKRQEDLEAMIQAQSERFIALQKKKTQREKRLYGNESTDLEDRKPAARVSSLRSKPSDPKTPRTSRDIVRRVSSGRKTDRNIRSPVQDKKTSVKTSASPPPSPPPHRDTRRYSSRRTWELEEEEAPPPTPTEERRPIFKPLLAPKPRISSEERTFGLPSQKLATPPDSPPPTEGFATPPDSPTPQPITEEENESADLSPPMRELPLSPSQRQRKLEDLPEEEHGSTQEVTAERPIRMEGMLEIKLKQGGNKGLDHWEEVFAVLEEETLSLFNDRAAAAEMASRWPPINMNGVVCRENAYYRRKENTFKLILEDSSQFLFAASSRDLLLLWVKKLQNCPERASSVNLSLEKLADAQEDSSSNKHLDRRAESLERQSSTENKDSHQTLPLTPRLTEDNTSRDKSKKSVFRKFFTKK